MKPLAVHSKSQLASSWTTTTEEERCSSQMAVQAAPKRSGSSLVLTASVCINGKDYSGFASAHHLGDDVVELVGLAKQGLARKVAPVIERGSPV